jgi:hypothetical protein
MALDYMFQSLARDKHSILLISDEQESLVTLTTGVWIDGGRHGWFPDWGENPGPFCFSHFTAEL